MGSGRCQGAGPQHCVTLSSPGCEWFQRIATHCRGGVPPANRKERGCRRGAHRVVRYRRQSPLVGEVDGCEAHRTASMAVTARGCASSVKRGGWSCAYRSSPGVPTVAQIVINCQPIMMSITYGHFVRQPDDTTITIRIETLELFLR